MPLPRPNEEFDAGLSSLLTVSWNIGLLESTTSFSLVLIAFRRPSPVSPACPVFGGASGFGGGVGNMFSSCVSKASPIRSVKNGVGQLGIGHDLEHVVARQPARQILVEAPRHRQ